MISTSVENVKELKGDGLRVNMDLNDINLKVSGDGCRVTVARNSGSIRMIGDGCSLKVNCNDGKIEYTGDGGSIFLGGGSRTESVSYVGDGGRINVRGTKIQSKKKKKSEPRCSLSDSELEIKIENETNEIKEAAKLLNSAESEDVRKSRNLKRSKTIVVTKIPNRQTPVNFNNNRFVQNWFRNPSSVIKTFESSSGPESF